MGVPQNGWFIRGNPNLKWMMTGVPPFMETPISVMHWRPIGCAWLLSLLSFAPTAQTGRIQFLRDDLWPRWLQKHKYLFKEPSPLNHSPKMWSNSGSSWILICAWVKCQTPSQPWLSADLHGWPPPIPPSPYRCLCQMLNRPVWTKAWEICRALCKPARTCENISQRREIWWLLSAIMMVNLLGEQWLMGIPFRNQTWHAGTYYNLNYRRSFSH